jgi:hypothetical protein
VAFIAGLLISGSIHAAKTMARPAITVITGGLGNWLVSLLEDLLVLIIVVLAILVPLLVLLLIATMLLFFARVWKSHRVKTGS